MTLPPTRRGSPPPTFQCPVTGQTWSGRGPTPAWLTVLVAQGRQPQEFLVPGARLPPRFVSAPSASSRHQRDPVFRCPRTGATWSGKGVPPSWFAAALAAGKRPRDLMIEGCLLPQRFRLQLPRPRDKPVRKRGPKPTKQQRAATPVFRCPETGATWGGRGSAPWWVSDYLSRPGASPVDLLVEGARMPDRFGLLSHEGDS